MNDEDREAVDRLLKIFRWETGDPVLTFQALVILRKARAQSVPTWDSFCVWWDH